MGMRETGTGTGSAEAGRRRLPHRIINRLPLRTRLTLWVVAIAVVMQAAVGGVFYLYQQQAVNDFFDDQLHARTNTMVDSLRSRMPRLDRETLKTLADAEPKNAMFSGFVLTVWDDQGVEVATTRREGQPAKLTPEEVRAVAASTRSRMVRNVTPETERADQAAAMPRMMVRAFTADDRRRYVLGAATSDAYAQQMLNLVMRAVLAAFLPGLVVAGLCGWVISGLAVRPIREVSEAARQLAPESIDRAMPLTGSSPEIERLQRDLENVRQRLASAFAAQERFMSNVSHELKTPIAVLLTEAQTLDIRGASKDVGDFVRSACDELRRLGGMVDSFLLLTRVRDGRSVVRNSDYLINELVVDSVSHCTPMADQHDVRLTPRLCETDLELRVRGDPALLRTMLDNLVRNAIRFSPKGGHIIITAMSAGNLALVRVRDFGPGIPESVIDRIFDRFVQAPDEQRRGRGQGLGLEIAQGIAELHGGKIKVRNCRPGDDSDPGCARGDSGDGEGMGGNGHRARLMAAAECESLVDGCEFEVRLPRVVAEGEPGRSELMGTANGLEMSHHGHEGDRPWRTGEIS